MELRVKKLHPNAITPTYQTAGAACFDIHVVEGGTLCAGHKLVLDTGLAVEVPEGHALLVFSRSGHGFKFDVRLANAVGVIDPDYRGGMKVKLTSDDPLAEDLVFAPGDRVAQAMVVAAPRVTFIEVEELSSTERGAGGFGSTGVAS